MPYLLDIITKEDEANVYLPNFPLQISVPHRLARSLPLKCRCGFLLKTNYKLTDTYCPNPYCFESNAYKVVKVFEKAHVSLDIGVKTAERILLHNKFSRHMDIFTIEDKKGFPDHHSEGVKEKWLKGLKELRSNVTFSEFIEYFQLDNIGGTKCSFIFSGMSSVKELEEALNKSSEFRLHISKVLGYASAVSDSTVGVYNALKNYLPIFKKYAPYFTFKKVYGSTMFIALTGSFTEFRPRSKFIEWLSENYHINPILVKYSSKANLLVYEEENFSTQFKAAKADKKAVHIDTFIKSIKHLRRDSEDE